MSKKKPKTIGASYPLSFMGCEGEVIVEMTPTEAVSMIEKAWQENKRLRQENATLTAERDEARRDAERWQADALRLIRERNDAMEERDEARRELCIVAPHVPLPPLADIHTKRVSEYAAVRGWDCWDRKDFCDKL